MNSTLTHRDLRPEIMDQPGLDAAEHARALRGLGRINRVSFSSSMAWPSIARLAKAGPVRVLDLASGGGDVPIALARRAAKAKLPIAVEGCDVSPEAVRFASAQAAGAGAAVRFFTLDALHDPIPEGYDVVSCSLFLHHLDEAQAVALLGRMAGAARKLIVVNDLERSRLGYALAWLGCRVLSRSPVVHHDGPTSVAGAFTSAGSDCGRGQGRARRRDGQGAVALPVPARMGPPMNGQTWDAVVLGAGPAGSIAARELAKAGASVLLVEKASFPRRKVCGACLNARALETLDRAGLASLATDLRAVPLTRFELHLGGRSARLDLPGGVALSRTKLDAALADAARDAGARVVFDTEARVDPDADADAGDESIRTVRLTRDAMTTRVAARVVVVAAGLGNVCLDRDDAARPDVAAGSKIGAGCSLEADHDRYRAGTIFMTVGRLGYVGLVREEDGRLNVAAAFDRDFVRASGSPGLAAEAILAEAGAEPVAGLAAADWRGTPALTRRARALAGRRMFLIGDAAGYVEPFTGEGMAWGLASGAAVAPLATRAIEGWSPGLEKDWARAHRRIVGDRQVICRAMALALRHPIVCRVMLEVVRRAPKAAGLVVGRINARHPLAPPS